jgi:nucleoside-diphosphate-sugar epimerase
VHVVVTGVGYTGRRVLALLPAGSGVGLSRPELDLDSPPEALPDLPLSYALLYTVPPPGNEDARLRSLLLLLESQLPNRIVYLSTSGVYGNADGAIVDESRAPAPATQRAKRRLSAENLLTDWCSSKDVELVILRVPGIYGPDRLGIERITQAAPLIAETDANPGNRIHVDDLAACCVLAMEKDAPPGIYNVGDGDHRSSTWFSTTVATLAGLDVPPEIPRADAKDFFSETHLSFLNESRILDTRKMREVLGFTPRYTNPEDGILASLL